MSKRNFEVCPTSFTCVWFFSIISGFYQAPEATRYVCNSQLVVQSFPYWGGWGVPPTNWKFAQFPPTWENFPSRLLPPKVNSLLWYHVLKFLKKALWLSGVNWDSSLVTQHSLKFYVWFSFFIVLLFLHCGSCFLFVWARMSQTAIVWYFFEVWVGHYQLFNQFSISYLHYKIIFRHNVALDV